MLSLAADFSVCSKIFTTSAASIVKTSAIWLVDMPIMPQVSKVGPFGWKHEAQHVYTTDHFQEQLSGSHD